MAGTWPAARLPQGPGWSASVSVPVSALPSLPSSTSFNLFNRLSKK